MKCLEAKKSQRLFRAVSSPKTNHFEDSNLECSISSHGLFSDGFSSLLAKRPLELYLSNVGFLDKSMVVAGSPKRWDR